MKEFPFRYMARVTIEFMTPFHVGSGREDDVADAAVVRDANGLPALPGSSLVGVIRSAYAKLAGESASDDVFGFQKGHDGSGSRLRTSWGCIHDASDTPVESVVKEDRWRSDAVLGNALQPTLRDHVRITHRGTSDAEGHGKFDELVVCAGHRFTFELELAGTAGDREVWVTLLALLASPGIRLGGKTRRGLGAIRVVRFLAGEFNLDEPGAFECYMSHPVTLADPCKLQSINPQTIMSPLSAVVASLDLAPCSYWMFGGGVDASSGADMAPVRDSLVVWEEGRGIVRDEVLVIPGSSVKGALSHRVAFHYNALKERFADGKSGAEISALAGTGNSAVQSLFGSAKGEEVDSGNRGQRGRILIDDYFVGSPPPSQLVHHVSLDRFTGGARDTALFSERPLWGGDSWPLRIVVVGASEVDPDVRQALQFALGDLAEARLALGNGSGRGNGYFTGKIRWSDEGAWIRGGQS